MQGFLCCDKPVGSSSRDVVNIVFGVVNAGRKRKERMKVGHTGTLDPLASGVLVVAIGAATRLSYLIGDMAKRYDGTFRLNASTASGDLDGDLAEHDLPIPTMQQLRESASQHVGEIQQTPPAHSAIHIDGVKAYKRVRAGEQVEMPSRTVRIDQVEVTRFCPPEFDIDVVCGGGTYMRTLGNDIAKAAGNIAVMTRLVRSGVGPFQLENAIDLQDLKAGNWLDRVQPLKAAAANLQTIVLSDTQSKLVDNGCPLETDLLPQLQTPLATEIPVSEIAAVNEAGQLRAIMVPRAGQLRCQRVFHHPV